MCRYAFELSEELELPVLLRSVTRISHASGDVELGKIERVERKPVFDKHWRFPWRWNVYGPPGPVEKHRWLHGRMPKIKQAVEALPWNELEVKGKPAFGVIASGIGASYARDALGMLGLGEKVAFLKLAAPAPIPEGLVERLLKAVRAVLVVEEGEPVIERQVTALAKDVAPKVRILDRLTWTMPAVGELNTDIVLRGIAKLARRRVQADREREELRAQAEKLVAPRSSTLCAGCPHLGSYWALKQALKKVGGSVPIVNGDIGCYEQGGYGLVGKEYEPSSSEESVGYPIEAPYETLSTNYIMGGGVGLMQGQFQAGYGDGSLVAVAGDSTFFHACIPAVLNAVYNKSKGLFLVLDNLWTAMTGHQPDLRTGKTATGEDARVISIEDLARACGVEFVRVVDPYDLEATQRALEEAIKSGEFAIVIARRVCALQAQRMKQFKGKRMVLNKDACTGCRLCISFGCPATTFDSEEKKAGMDPVLCNGCGMCAQVCPTEAIKAEE
jgi:indolepyruvate ferredoxin oxidoreductase alpha subunit